jgi:type VI secretion system protein ImpL
MKHILNLLQRHIRTSEYRIWLKPLSILLTSAVVIWFLGPHLSVAGHMLLKSVKRRLLAITLLSAALGVKFYLSYRKEQLKKATMPSALDKKLQILEGQVRGALNFLNKPLVNNQGADYKLHNLPWYLLIGPTSAGKTTLLANSNINFILKKQIKPEDVKNISASDSCSWWVTHDSVLLDVPGNYVNLNNDKLSPPNLLWPHFLDMIKKFRPDNSMSGVVVALPLSDLINQESRNQLIENLKNRITELRSKFGNGIPFYFTITKCDLLPGFTEFFGDCGSDELSQAWGVTLPTNTDHTSLSSLFAVRFNALIKRLNKQLIWRLHQERGLFERVHVKDFPLHIERLKDVLVQVLNALSNPQSTFNLQGVYLTSAIQPPTEKSKIHPQLTTNESQQALQIMHTPAMPSRSYFIRQMLLQGLLNSYGKSNKIWQERRLVYAICACGIAFTIIFSGYDIVHSKQQMLALQDNGAVIVPAFNIVMPEVKQQDQKISDTVTVIGQSAS